MVLRALQSPILFQRLRTAVRLHDVRGRASFDIAGSRSVGCGRVAQAFPYQRAAVANETAARRPVTGLRRAIDDGLRRGGECHGDGRRGGPGPGQDHVDVTRHGQ